MPKVKRLETRLLEMEHSKKGYVTFCSFYVVLPVFCLHDNACMLLLLILSP